MLEIIILENQIAIMECMLIHAKTQSEVDSLKKRIESTLFIINQFK